MIGLFGKKPSLGLLTEDDISNAETLGLLQMAQAFAQQATPSPTPQAGFGAALGQGIAAGAGGYMQAVNAAENRARETRLAAAKLAQPVSLADGGSLIDPLTGKVLVENTKAEPKTELQREAETLYPGDLPAQRKFIEGAREKNPWMSVPGLGVYNRQDGQMITPYGMSGSPAGGASPGYAPAVDAAGSGVNPLNVPARPNLPGVSPQGREKIIQGEIEAGQKRLEAMREAEGESRQMLTNLGQFEQALDTQEAQGGDTGGFLRKLPGSELIEGGLLGDREIEFMASIRDKTTPLMRQGMPGAASDRDVQMFRGATIGPEKSPEVNRTISAGLKTAAENKIGQREFFTWFAENVDPTLRGADENWSRYLEENPIFAADGTLNQSRTGWRDWLNGSQAQPQPQGNGLPALPPGAVLVGE